MESLEPRLTNGTRRIGMVAGWGSFPLEIARQCRQSGVELFIVGLRGHADPHLADWATRFQWMGVAKLGSHLRFFRRAGIREVAFAGKLFKHRLLYDGLGWLGLLPDWTCAKTMAATFLTRSRDGRDDTILRAVVELYESRGIRVLPIQETASSLLVDEGLLTGKKVTPSQMADIRFGWNVARQLAGLDIGQSITVKDQIVLGVEAIEGTDGLIERSGRLCRRKGFTLIKLAKPNQDMRFDVPTIGPRTIQKMASAGGKVIAIEAHKTILLDREKTVQAARRLGVVILALSESEAMPSLQASRSAA